MYVPDNYDQWKRHDRQQERQLEGRPECSDCGHTIQEEHYYLINDEPICRSCLMTNYRKRTDEYVG